MGLTNITACLIKAKHTRRVDCDPPQWQAIAVDEKPASTEMPGSSFACFAHEALQAAPCVGAMLRDPRYASQRPLNEHDLPRMLSRNIRLASEESIGGRFKMGGNAAQKMKMLAIEVRAD
jgi:hypothetical protein